MLRDNSQTGHVEDICDIESLTASIVGNVPDFNCTLSITCNEGIHIAWTVNTNKWRVMSIKPHDILLTVRVPNKDLEVETTAHKNLVPLRICNLSNSLSMALKDLCWFLGKIIVEIVSLTELTFAANLLQALLAMSCTSFFLIGCECRLCVLCACLIFVIIMVNDLIRGSSEIPEPDKFVV